MLLLIVVDIVLVVHCSSCCYRQFDSCWCFCPDKTHGVDLARKNNHYPVTNFFNSCCYCRCCDSSSLLFVSSPVLVLFFLFFFWFFFLLFLSKSFVFITLKLFSTSPFFFKKCRLLFRCLCLPNLFFHFTHRSSSPSFSSCSSLTDRLHLSISSSSSCSSSASPTCCCSC